MMEFLASNLEVRSQRVPGRSAILSSHTVDHQFRFWCRHKFPSEIAPATLTRNRTSFPNMLRAQQSQ